MTRVFARLGRLVAHHPRLTVALWLVLAVAGYALAVVGVHGESLFDRLSTGAPAVPGSESAQGQDILEESSTGGPSVTLAVSGVDPADPAVAEALAPLREDLAAIGGVATVIDPLALPEGVANPAAAPLVARDGDGFLVVVELEPDLPDEGGVHDEVVAALRAVPAGLGDAAPDARGIVGSTSLIVEAITDQVETDLRTGETVALPVALLVMVLVFGGFVAAAMPMAGAVASIAGGLAALLGFSYVLDMDSSVVNVVTVLGLGLSIDYGLLIVSRFREELHHLVDDDGGEANRRRRGDGAVLVAVERTMSTAGRTVTFSAVIVGIAISGLLVFRPPILRAFGAAGVAVVVVAVLTALTLVPALLTLTGRRLARPGLLARVPGVRSVLRRTADVQTEEGRFAALAGRVQRHPWWVMLGSLAVLGLLAVPLAHVELRNSTTELLPLGSTQREYVQVLREDYPAASTPGVTVVAETTLEDAAAWAEQVAELEGVASVDPPTPVGPYVVVGVRPDTDDPGDATARAVVESVRDLDPGFPTWVTGQAAGQIDFTAAVADRALVAAVIVAVATLVLLFLMTGSVVVPVKALLTNTLSLAASLGVLVWVFQDGHLTDVLDFAPVGGIETYVVALVVAFAFGLAMDYEVFLLSRIKELWDAGHDNDEAVRLGLQRSGRIITSAAAIVIVVFAGFVSGKLLVIKEVGFALAVAVLVDATLVRLFLVPATMTVLGRANWWAPRFLRRVHERIPLDH
ncbi:MMPL family transporter [Cellulomonas fimi]|uniref:Integral membrane protein n=1 Tax=Cellulomonas fimi (strain ATCC 484 / DSM 20113 / JCM 1341 / CCUG 24087 / LMG 16345 / NBRC 15513 / NCIMB 8980 / NCTC 7547 / NRS-133) TaxID=590998 RepID=F4H099_CELFA|nr:MMPL family transporter [Cellulomonas fimi]AEE46146.1 integral membrane protein [Cellulomonas fimi ATCC 484]NNH07067.1 MMPL family transporter [Cellulomonas fimi]VEH31816.1 Membrane transport protein mmpL8 [Cellulomonas fimi]